MESSREEISINIRAIKNAKSILTILGGIISFVWYISTTFDHLQTQMALHFQEIKSQISLQDERTNSRIDYLEGKIDSECFGVPIKKK